MKAPGRSRREFLAAAAAAAAALPVVATSAWGRSAEAPGRFPPDFLWGAATSAYQIEGAADQPGKGRSVWDEFVERRGAIADGASGRNACDFFHRYRGDIALMRALGIQAFRFSVAWTRVLPEGRGAVHQPGLDFYRRLVDALLEAGIAPVLTLFHWDTPSTLQRRGGWQDRRMAALTGAGPRAAARALL
ncbi:MAG: family 1 glycosylhydrolase [Terriglobales bacterium]